jgi:hypothetical protein
MARIVAATFETMPIARKAVRALRSAHWTEQDIEISGRDDGDGERRPGVVVSVDVKDDASEPELVRILNQAGARVVQCMDAERRARNRHPDSGPARTTPSRAGSARARVVYRIFPGGHGKWTVFDGEFGKVLSEFGDRNEAVAYATALAKRRKLAVVEIYRAGGVLQSSRMYASERHPAGAA